MGKSENIKKIFENIEFHSGCREVFEELEAENNKLKEWKSGGIPKDSGDLYVLKFDSPAGWVYEIATVNGGCWLSHLSSTTYNKPNYYRLLEGGAA